MNTTTNSTIHKRASFAEGIAGAIIFRINYPKTLCGKMGRTASLNARTRPLLTPEEEADTKQIVAMVLHVTGALEKETMRVRENEPFAIWRLCFSEVRRNLRIDRNSKRGQSDTSTPIDLLTETDAQYLSTRERAPYSAARRIAIARKIRYQRSLCFTAHAIDPSRKRNATLRTMLAFSRYVASAYSTQARGIFEIVESTADDDNALHALTHRFKRYTATAEEHLTAQAMDGVKARKLEFKTFAEYAEKVSAKP